MGFTLTKQKCRDINECKEYQGRCGGNLHCMNSIGSYVCGCRHGYKVDGTDCIDIDECVSQAICPGESACQNLIGNYTCQCKVGFEGGSCTDIDECANATNNCDENAACFDTEGSYSCYCKEGFHGNGKNCQEGQCDDMLCPETMKCISSTSDQCECRSGFILDKGGKFCKDIDECSDVNNCHENSTCINLNGGYSCVCKTGYEGNGTHCAKGFCTEDMCSKTESRRLYA